MLEQKLIFSYLSVSELCLAVFLKALSILEQKQELRKEFEFLPSGCSLCRLGWVTTESWGLVEVPALVGYYRLWACRPRALLPPATTAPLPKPFTATPTSDQVTDQLYC